MVRVMAIFFFFGCPRIEFSSYDMVEILQPSTQARRSFRQITYILCGDNLTIKTGRF
jgi:hypothetical protein